MVFGSNKSRLFGCFYPKQIFPLFSPDTIRSHTDSSQSLNVSSFRFNHVSVNMVFLSLKLTEL